MASGLATRCAACGTVFRVVPDQLRVSDGWVRCGRCSEVFNASLALLDLETGEPLPAPQEDAPPEPAAEPPFELELAPPEPPAHPAPPTPAPTQAPTAAPALPPPAAPAPPLWSRPEQPAEAASVPISPEAPEAPAADGGAAHLGAEAFIEGPDPREMPPPSFVRRADQAARWRRPRVRAALGAAAAVGLLLLAAQVLGVYRDLVAARLPAARPALAWACEMLACTIGPPRLIEALAVESSGLVRVEKSSLYKLNVALRNRENIAIALPALELSLTDSQGKLVARRVLRGTELGQTQAALAAGGDTVLQATLQAATDPVAGYTIELFYP